MHQLFWLLLFLLPFSQAVALYEPVAVYLTWQRNPESTMTISWITDKNNLNNTIEYQREGYSSWQKSQGAYTPLPQNEPYLLHAIELTNLVPNTTYSFRPGPDSKTYKFRTMPDTLKNEVRFVAGGDMYHDTVERLSEMNRQAAKTNPMFVLVGGDIAYAAGRKIPIAPGWFRPWVDKVVGQKIDRWLTWLQAWTRDMVTPEGCLIPILPVLGNHDVTGGFDETPAEAPFFYAFFAMPGRQGYNVIDFGKYMSIILLDSGHTHPIAGQQTNWLATTLKDRVNVPNKFALYHVPAYPSVRPMNNTYCSLVRNHWVPVFDQYRLTAAFENHDHDYKRTFRLRHGKLDPSGVQYIGDGAWGVDKPREVRQRKEKWYLMRTAQERHFIMVVLHGDKRHVTAITGEGKVLDQFSW